MVVEQSAGKQATKVAKKPTKGYRCLLNLRPDVTIAAINRPTLKPTIIITVPKWKGLHKQSKVRKYALVFVHTKTFEAWTKEGRQLALYTFAGVTKA